MTGVSGS